MVSNLGLKHYNLPQIDNMSGALGILLHVIDQQFLQRDSEQGGSKDREYLCLRQYCSCRSYSQMARNEGRKVLCKHLLAVKIARAMNLLDRRIVSDDEYSLALNRAISNPGYYR